MAVPVKRRTLLAAMTLCAMLLPSAHADDRGSSFLTAEELAARHPGLSAANVHDGPFEGLYEVVVGNGVSYVTTDGRYLIRGDIIDLTTGRNVTESRRAEARAALLATIDPATAIVFSPTDATVRHRIVVFTDVDCGYCRQFHRDIAAVNALGIEVRYVAYPRTGPDTASWSKAESVWCAADRNAALTRAKLGAEVDRAPECASTPVAHHYELGRRVGVTGTPAVYSESGVELGGYLPPNVLLAQLERLATR